MRFPRLIILACSSMMLMASAAQAWTRLHSSAYGVGVHSFGVSPLGVNAFGVVPSGITTYGVNSFGVSSLGVNTFGVSPFSVNTFGVSPLGVSTLGVSPLGVSTLGVSPLGVTTLGTSTLGVTPLAVTNYSVRGHRSRPSVGLTFVNVAAGSQGGGGGSSAILDRLDALDRRLRTVEEDVKSLKKDGQKLEPGVKVAPISPPKLTDEEKKQIQEAMAKRNAILKKASDAAADAFKAWRKNPSDQNLQQEYIKLQDRLVELQKIQ